MTSDLVIRVCYPAHTGAYSELMRVQTRPMVGDTLVLTKHHRQEGKVAGEWEVTRVRIFPAVDLQSPAFEVTVKRYVPPDE